MTIINRESNKMRRIRREIMIKNLMITMVMSSNNSKRNKINKKTIIIKSNKKRTITMIMMKIKNNLMSLANKSARTYLKINKTNSHNHTLKKTPTLRKVYKLKMVKLNYNYLRLPSLKNKSSSSNKFMSSLLSMIGKK